MTVHRTRIDRYDGECMIRSADAPDSTDWTVCHNVPAPNSTLCAEHLAIIGITPDEDVMTVAATLADGLPAGPWATAAWQPSNVLPAAWASDEDAPDDRGPFMIINCQVGDTVDDSRNQLARLVAMIPDLVVALAYSEALAVKYEAEAYHCSVCSSATGEACEGAAVMMTAPGVALHLDRLAKSGLHTRMRRLSDLPSSIQQAVWDRFSTDHVQ